jgi:2'-5' RNA ligase
VSDPPAYLKEDTLRLFIAVPLPPDVKALLSAMQQEFRRLAVQAAWVRESALHLTLKFFGEIPPQQVESIVSGMEEALRTCPTFSLTIGGIGVFPPRAQPRVLWVGVQEGSPRLVQCQEALEATLTRAGFDPEERPFRPHLTLARVKRVERRDDFEACLRRHIDDTFGGLAVTHLELLESQLHPRGARYSILAAVPLAS